MNVTNLPNFTRGVSGRQFTLLSFLFLYILGSSFHGYSQVDLITINGKIIASDDKQPIIGASIADANNKNIGVTNLNGEFSVKIKRNSSIRISYVGFTTLTKQFSANQDGITITLAVANTALTEVVVTALGIKREEKALGYAVTTLSGEQLTDAVSNNWTDALSGKVAGLNLVRSNGGPSGSTKIILRGENNLTGDNEALIVVDGVVINNGSGRSTGSGDKGYLAEETPVDFGNGIGDLNPEDIENVTILKGPGAAALYGQRGANGAIIITTKGGKANKKGLGITFNSNTALSTINRWPDLQYEYGQGLDGANYYSFLATEDGASTRSTSSAWGPRFDGQSFYQYDPVTHTKGTERTPWVPYVNDSRNFFNDATTFTNSVTLDGAGDKTSARFSYTNANNKWIIPNTGYSRNSVALSVRQKMDDKLTFSTKVNYTNKFSDNLPSTGYNNQSIMYWYIFWVPNADLDWLKDYWLPGQENRAQSYPFSSLPDNPYLIANQMLNKSNRNTITGNAQANYQFNKKLNLMIRTSIDLSQEQRSQQRPFDTEKFKHGMYRTQSIYSQEISTDFLLSYKTKIKKDFEVSGSVGGSMLKNLYNKDENRADSLLYPGVFTLANAAGLVIPKPYQSKYALNSFYGLFTAAYKGFLYLDLTARNDWNSVLATPTDDTRTSFFYPSASVSFVLSEALKLPTAVSFAKLRFSAASVGSGSLDAYRTSYVYSTESIYEGGLSNPTLLPNLTLEPLSTTTYEVGADLRFFKSRLRVDAALYSGKTTNQILQTTIDASSGYRYAIVNLGEIVNRGFELAVSGTPIKSKTGLTWTVNTTFSTNTNEVTELPENLPLILQNGPGSRGQIIASVGGSLGDLYGRGYVRSPDGQIVYEGGYPKLTEDAIYIGNTVPTWKTSLGNNFKYRQFSFNVLLDAQFGAEGYSLSEAVRSEGGKTKATLPGRYNGIIGNGVIRNTDGSYRPNDVIAVDAATYYTAHYGRDNVEGTTYSTDFLKVREARLDYTFSKKMVSKIGVQRATIGVYGRDLFTFSPWPGFDPEFGTLNGSEINRGFEYGQFPSTRTFGINLIIGI